MVTLAGLVPWAVSAVITVSRSSPLSAKYARMRLSPVSAPGGPGPTSRTGASRRQQLHEPVDVLLGLLLGHAHEQCVVKPRVVTAERVARVDALRAGVGDHVLGTPSDVHGKLLECCLFRK